MRQDAEHWHAVATQAVQPVSATLCLQHLLRSEAVVHYLYFLGYMPPMELRNLTAMKELIGGLDQSRLLLAQPGYCSQHGLRHALQLVGPSSPQQAEVVAASNGQYLWMCSNHSSGWLWPLVSAAATLVAAALGDAVAGFAAAAAAAAWLFGFLPPLSAPWWWQLGPGCGPQPHRCCHCGAVVLKDHKTLCYSCHCLCIRLCLCSTKELWTLQKQPLLQAPGCGCSRCTLVEHICCCCHRCCWRPQVSGAAHPAAHIASSERVCVPPVRPIPSLAVPASPHVFGGSEKPHQLLVRPRTSGPPTTPAPLSMFPELAKCS